MKRSDVQKALDAYSKAIADELRKTSVLTKAEAAINSLNHATVALEKIAIHMASLDYGNQNPCEACGRRGLSVEAAGKTFAYIAKVVNEQARLLEYAKGKPDQRTEVTGLADLLKILSNDEFEQVSRIIDTATKRIEQTSGTA